MADKARLDTSALIADLREISESRDHRIDKYIKWLQSFLEEGADLSEQHKRVFDLMLQEVSSDRRVRRFAFSGIAILVFVVILGGALSWYFERERVNRQELLTTIGLARLPLRFVDEDGQLFAVIDANAIIGDDSQRELAASLENVRFGQYPGLGKDIPLGVSSVGRDTWTVTPQNRGDQHIGVLRVSPRRGAIDRLNSVNLNTAVAHNEIGELHVKIVSVPEQWTEASGEESVQYRASYGVRQSDGDILWDNETITFDSSSGGNTPRGPFYVSHPRWPAIYVVTIAAGHWGQESEERATAVVYRFSSIAQALKLN